jgi:uncharacterized protein (DUF302 family)
MENYMTKYIFSTELNQPIDEAIKRLSDTLAKHNLGIVSDVNVAGIIKNKLDEDVPAYRILSACNPRVVKLITNEIPEAGIFLPCSIVAREVGDKTIFDFMDPITILGVFENETINKLAIEVTKQLKDTISDLEQLEN